MLQELDFHDAELALGVAAILCLEQVELTGSRLGHLDDAAGW